MKSHLALASLIFIMLLVTANVFAQGSLSGVVTDSLTHEKLVGVNVVLVGTGIGNATSIEGEYKIVNIPQRLFTVRV